MNYYNIIIWLSVAVAIYWFFCLLTGFKEFVRGRTALDYFIAGRNLSTPMFVFAATATSFSGWTFISHPGLIYSEGFPAAYASFYAITIPLSGVFFLKRQWMLGKRCGFVTPGEMFAAYYQSNLMRIVVVATAILFSVLYLAVQLKASGFLFHILTQGTHLPEIMIPFIAVKLTEAGALTINGGILLLSLVLWIYVIMGGLRAVAWMDTVQAVLLAVGIIFMGWLVLDYVGGCEKLLNGINALSQLEQEHHATRKYTEVSGMFQVVSDKNQATDATGSHWTGMFILTFMIALMGIQSSPEFSMWAFSVKSPKAFFIQQVIASAFIMGFILIFFTAIQGIGAPLLGVDVAFREAHPELTNNMLGIFLEDNDLMKSEHKQELIVPLLIRMMADTSPWLSAILAVCALAAIQSTAAPYMSTIGSMISRDIVNFLYKTGKNKNLIDKWQIRWAMIGTTVITGIAIWIATQSTDAIAYMGGLAVAFGVQMAPALMGLCWFPYLTRYAVIVGWFLGLVAVLATEGIIPALFGVELPWGRWPLTIHSAGWGLLVNLIMVGFISWVQNNRFKNSEQAEHRREYHNFFREYAPMPTSQVMRWTAVIFVGIWAVFAIGPRAVIGNSLFSGNWALFGMPSIWVWQILWWAIGVIMIGFLAYGLTFSTEPEKEITPLRDDASEVPLHQITPRG